MISEQDLNQKISNNAQLSTTVSTQQITEAFSKNKIIDSAIPTPITASSSHISDAKYLPRITLKEVCQGYAGDFLVYLDGQDQNKVTDNHQIALMNWAELPVMTHDTMSTYLASAKITAQSQQKKRFKQILADMMELFFQSMEMLENNDQGVQKRNAIIDEFKKIPLRFELVNVSDKKYSADDYTWESFCEKIQQPKLNDNKELEKQFILLRESLKAVAQEINISIKASYKYIEVKNKNEGMEHFIELSEVIANAQWRNQVELKDLDRNKQVTIYEALRDVIVDEAGFRKQSTGSMFKSLNCSSTAKEKGAKFFINSINLVDLAIFLKDKKVFSGFNFKSCFNETNLKVAVTEWINAQENKFENIREMKEAIREFAELLSQHASVEKSVAEITLILYHIMQHPEFKVHDQSIFTIPSNIWLLIKSSLLADYINHFPLKDAADDNKAIAQINDSFSEGLRLYGQIGKKLLTKGSSPDKSDERKASEDNTNPSKASAETIRKASEAKQFIAQKYTASSTKETNSAAKVLTMLNTSTILSTKKLFEDSVLLLKKTCYSSLSISEQSDVDLMQDILKDLNVSVKKESVSMLCSDLKNLFRSQTFAFFYQRTIAEDNLEAWHSLCASTLQHVIESFVNGKPSTELSEKINQFCFAFEKELLKDFHAHRAAVSNQKSSAAQMPTLMPRTYATVSGVMNVTNKMEEEETPSSTKNSNSRPNSPGLGFKG